MDTTTAGQGNLSVFVTDRYVRSAWIAFFTLWVLWGLSYFLRHAFGKGENVGATTTTAEDTEATAGTGTAAGTDTGTGTGTGTGKTAGGWRKYHTSVSDRIAASHNILMENTLLLLSVLTLNTFGSGSTRAVMILAWIFFAFTVINAITQVAVNHHFVRLAFNIIFYGVTLAIGGLAFSEGW